MIWFVSTFLAILLVAVAVKLLLNKKYGVSRMIVVLGCLFAATYIIYIPLYFPAYGILPAAIGNLIHVLRVITIDADITEFYNNIIAELGSGLFTKFYILILGVLHLSLPTVSALTAVTVLIRCFSSIQLLLANSRKRPIFIFSEANEKSLHLAKSFGNLKCDIVFTDTSAESIGKDVKEQHSIICKEESIAEISVRSRKGKDVHFFCISDDEDLSLGHSLQLIEQYSKLKESEQEHIHIYQFSKHRDFSVFIDSADKGSLDVQCINEYEMLIYNLLNKYPLINKDGSTHVLIHGLSDINTVALKAIAWCGQIVGSSLRISVVGIDIQNKVDDLKVSAPGIFSDRYNIDFYCCKSEKDILDTIRQSCSDANYIIVGENSDNATMERGILLRRLFYKLDKSFSSCPPIFCYIKDPAKFNLIGKLATAESNPGRKMSYDLIPFGSLDEVFTYNSLVSSPLEMLAKNVHLAYEEIFSDGDIDVSGALKRYNIFEVNKRSNRANALHIRYKLNMLGLDYTDDPEAKEVVFSEYCRGDLLDLMSVSEHNRWMAFLETEGWEPSQREDVIAYRSSGISKGRHNCPILKMHPYICDYKDLKELSIELENKDTSVYDKELIVKIPDILADKWGISNKKYKIIKTR